MLATLLFVASTAQAGQGPWTLDYQANNIYLGVDYYRYRKFRSGSNNPINVGQGDGLTATGMTGVWTMGLAQDVEFELKLGFEAVRVNNPLDPNLCSDTKPADWCDPSFNVGDIGANVKWRFVDELYASPVSIAISGAFRSGEAYANTRNRLTTLGDGQTDVGAGLSLGRTAALGRGWYVASGEFWYWYRFPNTRGGTTTDTKIPADEIAWNWEALFAFHPRFSIGPAMFGFHRFRGVAFTELNNPDTDPNFNDINAWSFLAAQQVKVGVKGAVYSPDDGPTLSITFLQTIFARNNPSNTTAVSVGLGWYIPKKQRGIELENSF